MHPNLLDQLRVFLNVAEIGTFSEAGRRLGKTVSTVSYGIATLEDHYQIKLFERDGQRPQLTKEGRAIKREAELLLRRVERLEGQITGLKKDQESDIAIAVENRMPRAHVATALCEIDTKYPATRLHVSEGESADIVAATLAGDVDIGCVLVSAVPSFTGVDGTQIGAWMNTMFAAPVHPLARRKTPFPLADLDLHRQAVLAPRPIIALPDTHVIHKTEVWSFTSYEMMLEIVRRGLAWAFAPEQVIAGDVAAGRLVALDCADINLHAMHRIAAIWRVADPPKAVGRALLAKLEEASRERPATRGG